ncbi:sulfotransferase family 2 domain-containing protein [Sagittula salina]|uniref:Sulfotransferase family 2 domain-containing protein n=1 Tax=Sagittula salina TaxID=2820268 RepID=A0A940MR16_9RHOB|nr:sulfotransferase family 2 domain-containing protein [Sagittula salina]MBP0483834.1 sulfotransferase family 2 domain-containing protein [Sagittula salina]
MIISPGRRYIFVHIPKTGGTSMASALEARAMRGDILIGDTPKAKKRRPRVKKLQAQAAGRLWKHSTLKDIEGVVGESEVRDYFVFTFVRNPWDRMVSYYHWLRAQTFDHSQVRLAQMMTFGDFVKHPFTAQAMTFNPYSSYVQDWTGEGRCNQYIRLEHWRNDMDLLEDHLGFVPGIGHLNRSVRHPDYRMYYTDQTAEVVDRICREDVMRFGYRF